MNHELTIEDIQEAMKLIREERPTDSVIYIDKFFIIEGNCLGPTIIKLTPEGLYYIKKFTLESCRPTEISTILGMKVVVS